MHASEWMASATPQAYGSFVAIGLILSYGYVVRAARGLGVREHQVAGLFLAAVGAALCGARVGYALQGDPGALLSQPGLLLGDEGGFSLSGALVALAVVCPAWLCWRGLPVLAMLAAAAPAAALGEAFARLGCAVNGCCYGRASALPWAFAQPWSVGDILPRHPAQIYSAVALLAIAWGLHRLRAAGARPLTMCAAWMMATGGERFLLELVRGDVTRSSSGLTPTQAICAALFFSGGLVWAMSTVRAALTSAQADGRNPSGPAMARQIVLRLESRVRPEVRFTA